MPLVLAQTDQNMSSNCSSEINSTEKYIESSINQSKAILLVTNSNAYKSHATNYYPTFNYLYYKWNTNGCNVTLSSVNLLFDFMIKSNSASCGAKHVVFVESSDLNSILDVIDAGTTSPAYCPLIPSNSDNHNTTSNSHDKTNIILSPLKQFKSNILPKDVQCKQGFMLVLKNEDNSPACVKPDTSKILVERGWAKLVQ